MNIRLSECGKCGESLFFDMILHPTDRDWETGGLGVFGDWGTGRLGDFGDEGDGEAEGAR